jgi:hypothetical protein
MVTVAERKAIERRIVFEKTQGICHFCGDTLEFEKYDLKDENEPGDVSFIENLCGFGVPCAAG